MKKTRLSVLLLGVCSQGFSQTAPVFTWQAALPTPDSTGYYQIAVTPAVSALAYKNGTWDIRIFAGTKEVPYVRSEAAAGRQLFTQKTVPFLKESASSFIIENTEKRKLDKLELVYKNSRVKTDIQITGSNNGTEWYGLTERFPFDPAAGNSVGTAGTTSSHGIQFPASDYRYYRLRIHDSLQAPLYLEGVTVEEQAGLPPAYTAIHGVSLSQVQPRHPKESIFLIDLRGAYPADQMTLHISAPALYLRQASLMRKLTGAVIRSWKLSSDHTDAFELPPAQYDSLYLVVQNEDSPPLVISGVTMQQKTSYLVALLGKGQAYVLRGGAPLATPSYDLDFFKDRLENADMPVLTPAPPEKQAVKVTPTSTYSFFTSGWWIWAGILLVIGVLGLVVQRMVSELRDRNTP